MCSAEDVGTESVELVPGGEKSSLVAKDWLAGLVKGVSFSWQYCCSLPVASKFSSIVFTAEPGAEEGERDVLCACCGLVVEG